MSKPRPQKAPIGPRWYSNRRILMGLDWGPTSWWDFVSSLFDPNPPRAIWPYGYLGRFWYFSYIFFGSETGFGQHLMRRAK